MLALCPVQRVALVAALVSMPVLAASKKTRAVKPKAAEASDARPTVLVLSPEVMDLPEADAKEVGTRLLESVRKLDYLVVEDASALAPEKQKALHGADLRHASAAVLAAGKRFVVGSRLSRLGGTALLQLWLLDARNERVLGRETVYFRGQAAGMAPALPSSARALLFSLSPEYEPGTPDEVARRNVGFVNYCYEEQLRSEPGLSGKLHVAFRIGKDGIPKEVVIDPKSTLTAEPVRTCVLAAASTWRFSPGRRESVARASYLLRSYDEPARVPSN